jgi:LysM repeat protein
MLHMQHFIRYVVLAMILSIAAGIAACTPQTIQDPIPTSTQPGTLTPFHTATISSTPTPVDRTTPSPLPSPTPTLRSHVITRGEDLGGIAFRYRVGLPALLEANPDVDPYFLVVDSTLNIPTSNEPVEQTPAPTPVAIQFSPVQCNLGRDGGAWCFVMATNSQSFDVESISAIIRVADEGTDVVISQIAVPPLDLLPAGSSMPLAAYFPPKLPDEPLQASAELLTSLPVFPDSKRYLPVAVEELAIHISEGGMEAEVSGQVNLGDGEQEASFVWVAAVAYDQQGSVIGLRRWENQNPLPVGKGQPFTFWVYSTGSEIERVEVLAEARPNQR